MGAPKRHTRGVGGVGDAVVALGEVRDDERLAEVARGEADQHDVDDDRRPREETEHVPN